MLECSGCDVMWDADAGFSCWICKEPGTPGVLCMTSQFAPGGLSATVVAEILADVAINGI